MQEKNYYIFLNTGGIYFGTISGLSLTNNLIAFTLTSSNCIKSFTGNKDTTYNETTDPISGTVSFTNLDTIPPVITLTGLILIDLTVGDTYSDPGVTAADDIDGDLTSSVTSTGTVDTSTVGFYSVLFSVSDAAGNSASVYREIRVSAAATTYSISVTASTTSDYGLYGTDVNGTVNGDDASITINAGDTLSFTIYSGAFHPFYIKTAQGSGTDNQASNVTNNGATSRVVNWTPTAAATYYYQCSVHDGMYGTITVQ